MGDDRATPPIIRPKALAPGDTVAVAALSGPLEAAELEMYRHGIAALESMGFRVRPAPLVDVEKMWWWGAARPTEVGRELNELFRDPDVRGIWGLVGGRLTLSYLDVIDYGAIAANPKVLVGMSDIGALHLAIHSMTGLVTFHADLLMYGVGEWHELPERDRSRLIDIYRRVLTSTEPAGRLPALSTWECWRPGRAEGHLLGGLLHRLVRIQATPWAFAPERFDGAILFFEDLNTSTINVWNDLQILRHGGVLDRIAGLLVGPTETIQVAEEGPDSLREVVLDVIGDREIPVLGNLDIGHAGPNIPLPLGVRAAMDGDARTLELIESAVS